MDIILKIKSNPKLKKMVLYAISPPMRPRPRWWVRVFVNPFFHKRGKHSLIRKPSRMDLFPFHRFELGKYSTIETFATVNNGAGDVIIGDNVRVGIGSVIIGPVIMKNGSGLGQHVFISGFNHGYADASINSRNQPLNINPVIIEEEAHIGANSVVLAGVTIGTRTQIGAGSVVTKSIPPYCMAAGNPCRVIKRFNFETQQWERID